MRRSQNKLKGWEQAGTLDKTKKNTATFQALAKTDQKKVMETMRLRQRSSTTTALQSANANLMRGSQMQQQSLGLLANMAGHLTPAQLGRLTEAANSAGGAVGGGGGKGFVGALSKSLGKADTSKELWNRIAKFRGGIYDIGGTHHDEGAYERDINVYGGKMYAAGEGMTSKRETKYLSLLARAMNKVFAGKSGYESIFDPHGAIFGGTWKPGPYGGHRAHYHMSTPFLG